MMARPVTAEELFNRIHMNRMSMIIAVFGKEIIKSLQIKSQAEIYEH